MEARKLTELTEYRERFDPPLTLEALATKLDATPAAVSRWINGKRAPNRQSLLRIAELTGTSAAQLAGLDQ